VPAATAVAEPQTHVNPESYVTGSPQDFGLNGDLQAAQGCTTFTPSSGQRRNRAAS
jgi:hypothetical protein